MDEQRIIELRMMAYEDYLKTTEWMVRRDWTLQRDGHRCRLCNGTKNLQVHHRTYERRGNEDPNDLTTLCEACHESFHEKRIGQEDMAQMTYESPRFLSREEARRRDTSQWEYYFVGVLALKPELFLHVNGITEDSDFSQPETLALYKVFVSASPLEHPFSHYVPSDLEPIHAKAIKTVEEALGKNPFPKEKEMQIKEVIEVATRLKRARLMQMNTDLQNSIKEAFERGEKEKVRALQQELLAAHQQLRTIDSATHIQG